MSALSSAGASSSVHYADMEVSCALATRFSDEDEDAAGAPSAAATAFASCMRSMKPFAPLGCGGCCCCSGGGCFVECKNGNSGAFETSPALMRAPFLRGEQDGDEDSGDLSTAASTSGESVFPWRLLPKFGAKFDAKFDAKFGTISAPVPYNDDDSLCVCGERGAVE